MNKAVLLLGTCTLATGSNTAFVPPAISIPGPGMVRSVSNRPLIPGTSNLRGDSKLNMLPERWEMVPARKDKETAFIPNEKDRAQNMFDFFDNWMSKGKDTLPPITDGNYADPNHKGCPRNIKTDVYNHDAITIYGCDGSPDCIDGCTSPSWLVHGMVQGDKIIVDFSPKGGPKDFVGTWNGVDTIAWADGNAWTLDPLANRFSSELLELKRKSAESQQIRDKSTNTAVRKPKWTQGEIPDSTEKERAAAERLFAQFDKFGNNALKKPEDNLTDTQKQEKSRAQALFDFFDRHANSALKKEQSETK